MIPINLSGLPPEPEIPLLDVSGLNKLGQMLEVLDAHKDPALEEIGRNSFGKSDLGDPVPGPEWMEMLKGRLKFLNQGWRHRHHDNLRKVLRLVDEAYRQYRPEFYPVFGREIGVE